VADVSKHRTQVSKTSFDARLMIVAAKTMPVSKGGYLVPTSTVHTQSRGTRSFDMMKFALSGVAALGLCVRSLTSQYHSCTMQLMFGRNHKAFCIVCMSLNTVRVGTRWGR
jgi:hypothetical protein